MVGRKFAEGVQTMQTVRLSVSQARLLKEMLNRRFSGPDYIQPPLYETLDSAILEAVRTDRPQKFEIEVVY